MNDLDTKLRSAIDRFAGDLGDLVRNSALESVRGALAGAGTVGREAPRGPAATRSAAPVARNGAKRPPEELEKITARLLEYVTANPGQRIEEIAGGMGVATRDLVLPAKKLLAAKAIKKRGVKRATRYLPR